MNKLATTAGPSITAVETALVEGDIGKLSTTERLAYYKSVCNSLGLNPLTRPFEYLRLNGRTVMYATRNCTDQLRNIHKVTTTILSREKLEDVYVVVARASTPDGRSDESIGAVAIGSAKGEPLANILMKAETKAKRRATLSLLGLSLLDETEIGSVPNAHVVVDSEAEHVPSRDWSSDIAACSTQSDLDALAAEIKAAGLAGSERTAVAKSWSKRRDELKAKPVESKPKVEQPTTDFEEIPEHQRGDAWLPKEVQ